MKISIKTPTAAGMIAFALLGTINQGTAQTIVNVDPASPWVGYMNVFNLPSAGGAYQFGSSWGTADLRAAFAGNTLTFAPCTNVWETTDTYWVQADGVTPNKTMDANMYVQNDALAGQTVSFLGSTVANTLSGQYTVDAFIKDFNSSYSLVGSATVQLVPGQFFDFSLATLAGDHIQYGFEMIGPDANPFTAGSLGFVQVVPEPSTLALVGIGLAAPLFIRRRK
jgi:hypothetical protein